MMAHMISILPTDKMLERYTYAILCGKIHLWDIPRKERRGKNCCSYYIAAYRYARDSGKGRSYFQGDLSFLERELRETSNTEQRQNLFNAQCLMKRYAFFP